MIDREQATQLYPSVKKVYGYFSCFVILNISLYLYEHCHKNSNKHWLSLVPFSAVIDLKRPCFNFTAKHFFSSWSYLFYYWQSYQQKVLNFIVLQFSQHITHLTAKFFSFSWRAFDIWKCQYDTSARNMAFWRIRKNMGLISEVWHTLSSYKVGTDILWWYY